MKLLNPSVYAALKNKADGYDAIIAAIVSNGEDISPDEVTADTVIQMLNDPGEEDPQDPTANDDSATDAETDTEDEDPADEDPDVDPANDDTDIQAELDAANATIASLQEEIAAFNAAPAEDPATIAPKSEPGAQEMDLATFADKNAGDTHAILDFMKKTGAV